ncbi:MAG: DUF3604 domain-containing protein [Pseudomonadales bacterium]
MKIAALGLAALLLSACDSEPMPDSAFASRDFSEGKTAQPCAEHNPLNNAYFGDLHVHTSWSNDAYSFDVRTTPSEAYGYAFGESVYLPPLDAAGNGTREVSIDRPLDFMAVTDHSEFLGEQTLCLDPSSEVYNEKFCGAFREGDGRSPSLLIQIVNPRSSRNSAVCGDDGKRCDEAMLGKWKGIIDAAQKWQDFSDNCDRTAFVGYEYSSFRLGSNLHRNVIFRNATVPQRPVSYIDRHREWDLWQLLKNECNDAGNGCQSLAIPHNSNISNGRMFSTDYAETSSTEEQVARANLRIEMEPVIEIMQHKGDSECRNGLPGVLGAEDEFCDYEKFENGAFEQTAGGDPGECYDGPLADYMPHLGPSCLSRNSYVRYALIEGLREEERIGVNPFKFGITASTDTHNGTGGGVAEKTFAGHLGMGDDSILKRASVGNEFAGNSNNSPGGLIGVWAPENSRAALFDAIRNKEVFGTSGPRIKPRLFGGWNYDESLCSDPELVARAYEGGAPMGQDLPAKAGSSPVFIATAQADLGSPGTQGMPLQTLQLVKGWVDDEGNHQQRVFDVAGDANNGATVDPLTCQTGGEGFAQLCAVWKDPDFDVSRRAVYYARAVENPSCRYNAWQCSQLPSDQRPASCDDTASDKVIQERAWTSPIWYTPLG